MSITTTAYVIYVDCFSFWELGYMAKEMGYHNVSKFFYKVPKMDLDKGLRLLYNDSSCVDMIKQFESSDIIEIYFEHGVEVPTVLNEPLCLTSAPQPAPTTADLPIVNENFINDNDETKRLGQ
ncbi:hypothetical protein CFOL_v3_13905 [Cephalotus follicularis]|uniref:PB1-like domain-containing protein n=1 Tax=Cephalotus follicularis TaxID=3775 RepID=A0A1Q3BQR7_CEPFO|nr:hypothetical protein CFOL_v3_13905 [Cephalotus follicularis]